MQLELATAEAAAAQEQRDQAAAELDSMRLEWEAEARQLASQLDDARKEIVNQRARVEELERELSRLGAKSADTAAAASVAALRKALADKHLLEVPANTLFSIPPQHCDCGWALVLLCLAGLVAASEKSFLGVSTTSVERGLEVPRYLSLHDELLCKSTIQTFV